MPELSKDLVALLQYLAPGFIVAWVFFGLTSHNKPSQFERVVQALIFTVVIQMIVLAEERTLKAIGRTISFGEWTDASALVAALLSALVTGVCLSAIVNTDALHRLTRRLGISSRTGHPCEWFGIFTDYPRYIALQLKDGSRVFGWPTVWPSESGSGHFFVTSACRTVDGAEQDLGHLEGILIDAKEVSWVEFVKQPEANHEQITTTSATSI